MKLTTSILAGAAFANTVAAHYFFDILVIDGQETKSMQYVRENTRPEKYNPTKWKNVRDDMTPDLDDFRCNKGAFESAGRTQTAEVKAGSKLAMKLAVGATMQHPGPQMVYMSKAPSTVSTYEGDGDWFKIMESGVCDPSKDFTKEAWCSWDKDRIEFTIPEDTPEGEYLIRPEHIGLHGAHDGQAEFYYGCAQVKVVGGGSGTPGPTAKIPGIYKVNDPEVNFSLWSGYKEYTIPGPAIWTGGSTGAGGNAGGNAGDNAGNSSTPVENELPEASPSDSASPAQPFDPSATPVESFDPSASPAQPFDPSASPVESFDPSASPVESSDPSASPVAAAAHSAENCNGGKLARTRRAFREMLLKL